jgi:hypothetical protein
MTKLEKIAGAKAECPSCHGQMECVEYTYKDEPKLQWRNPDGTSHYDFDFKTKTTSCRLNTANVRAKVGDVGKRGQVHLKDLKTIPIEDLPHIQEEVSRLLDYQLARIFYIEEGLRAKGIEPTGPFVGMLFIQQLESLRQR